MAILNDWWDSNYRDISKSTMLLWWGLGVLLFAVFVLVLESEVKHRPFKAPEVMILGAVPMFLLFVPGYAHNFAR